MRFSKDHAAKTRARILERAAALVRRDGVSGMSVPGLMREAGLTHGGFYAHFKSKDALVAEAVSSALASTTDRFAELAEAGDDPVGAVIDAYVSEAHRDHPEMGCAVAAVGPEAARESEEAAKAMAASARRMVDRLKGPIAERRLDLSDDDVLALVSDMVGAIVASRACKADPGMSDAVLRASRERLKRDFARPRADG